MMDKPVYHRCGHLVICKDAAPLGELQIGRKEKTLTLITVRYHTEQELGTVTVDRDIPPFIEDQQIKAVQFAAKPFQSAVFPGFRKLEYKMEDHGGILIRVPRTYPSSQLCSCCGRQNSKVKDLTIRAWTCPECGAEHDRDVNAAVNILAKGLDMLAS